MNLVLLSELNHFEKLKFFCALIIYKPPVPATGSNVRVWARITSSTYNQRKKVLSFLRMNHFNTSNIVPFLSRPGKAGPYKQAYCTDCFFIFNRKKCATIYFDNYFSCVYLDYEMNLKFINLHRVQVIPYNRRKISYRLSSMERN